MLDKKLTGHLKKNYAWVLETLKQYVSIPSISAQGKGINETAHFLVSVFRQLGFKVRVIKSGGHPVVYAELKRKSARKTILFYNHYDVQPPDPLNEWVTPPFKPSIRSGRFFGRGCSDDKGHLIVRLGAVKSFLDANYPLPVNVKCLVEGEEEIGSPTLPRFMNKYRSLIKADLCIWEAGGRDEKGYPVMALGCKGLCAVELVATGARSDLHSSQGVVVPNPAWRLVWTLAGLKDKNERILIPGFYDKVRKIPPYERTLLKKLKFHERVRLNKLGIKQFVLGLRGERVKQRYFYAPVLNINGLTSGYQGKKHKTVLPAVASAKIDFRLVPDQKPDDVLRRLRRHLRRMDSGVSIGYFHGYPPARTNVRHPYVKMIKSVLETIHNRPAMVEPLFIASGPMYLFSPLMPCVCTGVSHPKGNIHAPNENIYLRDIRLGMKAIAGIMSRMGIPQ